MLWSRVRDGALHALSTSTLGLNLADNAPNHTLFSSGWTSERQIAAREATRDLWNHGFDGYMHHAFPMDELAPIACRGRGPDWNDPSKIHLNDVNANVSVTLIDNLDSFVVMNNITGFHQAIQNVIQHVQFDVNTKPQVFETTIRVMGGLLSGHLFASEPQYGFQMPGYQGELLSLAHDLGKRLLPAFDTPTGMPYARINLRSGVQRGESTETCSAGAGSLLLEFATLSRLTDDPRFEAAAFKAFFAVWNRRSSLGLIGNGINVVTGSWILPENGGVGAGIDSFYEYALKMYVLTGETQYLDVWNDGYRAIMKHSRGRDGFWYRSISTHTGELAQTHIDSLGAFWPGLQILGGDVESAVQSHLAYWNLWNRYSAIPETFNIMTRQGISLGYPLRPEFVESTYFLYRATRDSFYLDVGHRVLEDITRRTKVECGLSTLSNVVTGEWEDRMESFALSETLKYLYLLFDESNPINSDDSNFVFSTEGHILILNSTHLTPPPSVRGKLQSDEQPICPAYDAPRHGGLSASFPRFKDSPHHFGLGLRGSVRSRPDFEYARVLSGVHAEVPGENAKATGTSTTSVPVVSDEDKQWWDPQGWCEVPKVDEYTLEWLLSSDGGHVEEDHHPGVDKIQQLENGWLVSNINGLKIKVTARVDRTGYDVTQLGPYQILPSQKVYITDEAVTTAVLGKKKILINPTPDVVLTFSISRPPLSSSSDSQSLLSTPASDPDPFYAVGSTALFGGNPGRLRAAQSHTEGSLRETPLLFGPESPSNGAIQILRYSPDNPTGCHDHILPNSRDPDHVQVLFIQRGECTFLEKLMKAKEAGVAGVIVWNDKEEYDRGRLVNPSIDKSEEELAKRALGDVAIVVVDWADGRQLDEMLELVEKEDEASVVVEVSAQERDELVEPRKTGLPRDVDLNRILYINGYPLRNTVLVA